jgi:hypothetical protein
LSPPRTQDERLDGIGQQLRDIHDRLFVDNGRVSLQTRLDRIERKALALAWTLSALAGITLSTVVPPLIHRIAEALS